MHAPSPSANRQSEALHARVPLPARLRVLAVCESLTLLLLALVAVPLKYLLECPQAVSVIGPIHGICFVLYLVALGDAVVTRTLRAKVAWLCVLAAFVPLGGLMVWRRSSGSAPSELDGEPRSSRGASE